MKTKTLGTANLWMKPGPFLALTLLLSGILTGKAQFSLDPTFGSNAPVAAIVNTPLVIQLQGAILTVCTGSPPVGPVNLAIASNPVHGTLSAINTSAPIATVTYTPNPNFIGMDSFVWTINFGINCNTGFVTQPIIVNPRSEPPVAQNLSATVAANRSGTIQLIGSDPENDPLTFHLGALPTNGTLSGTPPNLTYTPSVNFIGSDSFTYTVRDSQNQSPPATVSIRVVNGIIIGNATVREGNTGITNARFTISLTAPAVQTVSVNFRTADGSARAPSDYVPTNGTVTFPARTSESAVNARVIGDRTFELDERFSLQLSSPVNAILVNNAGVGTILNDDSSIGTSEMSPSNITVRIGEPVTFSVTWIHPERWRLLDSIDLLIVDEEGAALAVRWHEPEATFSLFNPASERFIRTDLEGTRVRFDTSHATLFLEDSGGVGSGPTGPSVTIHYTVAFKPRAAGRTFSVEAFATDDFGNEHGFDPVGAITVLSR